MNENSKRKVILYGLLSLAVIIVGILGATYAYFTSQVGTNNEQLVTTGTLQIRYDQGDMIVANNLKPATITQVKDAYTEGNCLYTDDVTNGITNEQICAYNTFTITNTGSLNAIVTMTLTDVVNTYNNLKYEVFEGINAPNNLVGLELKDNTILSGLPNNTVLPAITNNSKIYTILIWLDEDATVETDANKSYTARINAEAIQSNKENGGSQINGENGGSQINGENHELPYYIDASNANAPVLADGMIPVMYDGTNWVKADYYNQTSEYAGYDYQNKKWANAVMVTNATRNTYMNANAGQPVLEADILAYYVWIPRYKYKIFVPSYAYDYLYGEMVSYMIDVVFELGTYSTGTVTCTYDESGNETCTNKAVGNYYTHPAFTFGSTELTGIWVGKFETTGSITTPTIKPNLLGLKEQTIGVYYTTTQKFGTIDYLTTEGVDEADSHMMKSIEWGAVAYLKQSIFGLGIAELYINNSGDSQTFASYTGRSGGSATATATEYGTYSYDGRTCETASCTTEEKNAISLGQGASTTGNITGVYDMSGGGWEYVMGNYEKNENDSELDLTSLNAKYYDLYAGSNEEYSHLGDATGETFTWYNNSFIINGDDFSWLLRGGASDSSNSGLFCIDTDSGAADAYGFRSVLILM